MCVVCDLQGRCYSGKSSPCIQEARQNHEKITIKLAIQSVSKMVCSLIIHITYILYSVETSAILAREKNTILRNFSKKSRTPRMHKLFASAISNDNQSGHLQETTKICCCKHKNHNRQADVILLSVFPSNYLCKLWKNRCFQFLNFMEFVGSKRADKKKS